jgi:hypothetical protein
MLVAMIMSLGVMGGINSKSNDSNLQQAGIGCAYMSGVTEGGASNAWSAGADWCIGVSSGGAIAGLAGSVLSTTNPVGWGYWVGVGLIGL